MGSLSFTQAMAVAYDIKKSPQDEKVLTDYLTKEEKELVKVALKYLYASEKAMKTFWFKMSYIDAAIKAVDAKRNATSEMIKANAQYTKTTSMVKSYMALRDSLDAKWDALTTNQKKVYRNFQKELGELYGNLLHAMKVATKSSKLAFLNSDVVGNLTVMDLNRHIQSTENAGPRAARGIQQAKAARIKLQKTLAVESPGLAQAVKWFYKQSDAVTASARKTFGVPLHMGHMNKMIKENIKISHARLNDFSKAAAEGAIASSRADEAQKTLQIAGAWYVVAAMGDALTELAQNLAY